MRTISILPWLESFVEGVRRTQVLTIAALVEALLVAEVVCVTVVGREVRGVSKPRYGIKRLDRFLGNHGIAVREVQKSIAKTVSKRNPRPWRVALDWTSLSKDRFSMLTASVVVRGRAFPIFWLVERTGALKNRKTFLVKLAVERLREIVPEGQEIVLLADREFGNCIVAKAAMAAGFGFVLRCRGCIYIDGKGYSGAFSGLDVRGGRVRLVPQAQLTRKRSVIVTAVATWQRGQKEAWYLISNLDEGARAIIHHYGRRFRIEEMFRDSKEMRFGLKIEALRVRTPERVDRVMLLLALAYLLWLASGEDAVRSGRYRDVQTNSTARRTLSIFRLGQFYLKRHPLPVAQVFVMLAESMEAKWG